MQYAHAQQFIGGFYAAAPSDVDAGLTPGFHAMAVDTVFRALDSGGKSAELLRGKYFHGKSGSAVRDDLLEMVAVVLPGGGFYVSWHPAPEASGYWPLVGIFDTDDDALGFIWKMTAMLATEGVGFEDMFRAEQNDAVLPMPFIMRGQAVRHLLRRGSARLPSFLEKIKFWWNKTRVDFFLTGEQEVAVTL